MFVNYIGNKGKFHQHGRFGTIIIRDNSFENRISSTIVFGAKHQVPTIYYITVDIYI